MPFKTSGSIRYFQFDLLQGKGLTHAVFTRRGGASTGPWASLNVGGTVGDDPQHVTENRERSFRALNRPVESLYDVWQVHSADVVCTNEPRPLDQPHIKADAILTDRPDVTLFMRFGDCVPVLLFDPNKGVVGIAHAGWPGTVRKTVAAAVREMSAVYGSRPADILAGIGPSIGPDHYEIGPDVIAQVRLAFGEQAERLLPKENGAVKFDLWAANRYVLEQAGVTQVETAGICTACCLDDWFSHRAERGRTGRFGALIGLEF